MSTPLPMKEAPMFVTCPLCISATGSARTRPEVRVAEVRPFTFASTTVEVIPCIACRADHGDGLVSVTLRKSRALELEVSSASIVKYRAGGVVFFAFDDAKVARDAELLDSIDELASDEIRRSDSVR